MTIHALRSIDGHRRFVTLTDLNQRTSVAYYACEMNGGHRPSGDSVERQFPGGPRALPICSRCRVPYGGPKRNWSSGA